MADACYGSGLSPIGRGDRGASGAPGSPSHQDHRYGPTFDPRGTAPGRGLPTQAQPSPHPQGLGSARDSGNISDISLQHRAHRKIDRQHRSWVDVTLDYLLWSAVIVLALVAGMIMGTSLEFIFHH